jgi:hypothetical protein
VPPYRHTAYVVFKRLPLKNYGNGLPNISVEVVNTPPVVPDRVALDGDDGGTLGSNFVRDPGSGRFFRVGFNDGVLEVFKRDLKSIARTIDLPDAARTNPVSTPCYVPTKSEIWAPYNTASACNVAIVDAHTLAVKAVLELTLASTGPAFYNPTRDQVVVYDHAAGDTAATIDVTTRAATYADPLLPGLVYHAVHIAQYGLIALSGSGRTLTIQSASIYQTLASYTAPEFATTRNHIAYDRRRDLLYWSNGGGATPSKNLYTLDLSQGAPLALSAPRTLPVKPSGGMTYHPSQDLLYVYEFSPSDTLYGLDPDTLGTTIALSQPAANPDPYLSDARLGNTLIAGDGFAVSLRARFPNNGTTVGSIVSEICKDAGLTGADIDVISLTQGVHGYVRAQPMEAQAAIMPLMTAFLFDAQESEYKLKFVKRTNAGVDELGESKLGAHEAGQEPVDPLIVTRTQEAEMPEALSIHTCKAARSGRGSSVPP